MGYPGSCRALGCRQRKHRAAIVQMAGSPVSRHDFSERRRFGSAARVHVGTAGVEMTARRRIDRARYIALENDALALSGTRLWDRHRGQQRLRVRMKRHLKETLALRHFDNAAKIHDGDAVRDVLD